MATIYKPSLLHPVIHRASSTVLHLRSLSCTSFKFQPMTGHESIHDPSWRFPLVECRRYFSGYKPPRRSEPCRLDFDFSSIVRPTLPQSPLPSRPHSWLPSTNTPYFILASLNFLFPLFVSPSPFPSFPHVPLPSLPIPPIYVYNMPIQLHYIQLYRLCCP